MATIAPMPRTTPKKRTPVDALHALRRGDKATADVILRESAGLINRAPTSPVTRPRKNLKRAPVRRGPNPTPGTPRGPVKRKPGPVRPRGPVY